MTEQERHAARKEPGNAVLEIAARLATSELSNVTAEDVRAFVGSLMAQGTPWATGCAAILISLWSDREILRTKAPVSESAARPDPRSKEGHKARHVELHKALDELFADFIRHNPDLRNFTTQPIMALLKWSNQQQQEPTEVADGR